MNLNDNLYPEELHIIGDIKDCHYKHNKHLVEVNGIGAINITIKLSSTHYDKNEIKKELSKIFQTILKYYD